MLSALSSIRPAAMPRPAAAPPAATSPPSQPADTLDLSKIDCPTKAALLPALEPAVQLGVVAGIMFAVMSGAQSGAVPLVSVDVGSKSADKLMTLHYDLDMKNGQCPLSGAGTIGGQDATASLSIGADNQGAILKDTIGGSSSELAIGVDQQGVRLTAQGRLGDVAVDLSFAPIQGSGGKDDFKGFHVEGQLGGQAYVMDNQFDPNRAMDGQQAHMTSRGKLGDQEIAKDYTITASQSKSGMEVDIAGSGTTAGIAQEVQVRMALVG
jgi:hypothetical protein